MPCTAPIIAVLEPFRPLFTAPTWKKMLTLLQGTLLMASVPQNSNHCSAAHWP